MDAVAPYREDFQMMFRPIKKDRELASQVSEITLSLPVSLDFSLFFQDK
jgi:hypothetical protein